jgi:alpha-1,2-mannosyltransferase
MGRGSVLVAIGIAQTRGVRLRLAAVRASVLIGLGALPLVLIPLFLVVGGRSFDFHTFWAAGGDVLAGRSPYPAPDALPAVADRMTFRPFAYPAPAAFLMVPFAVLPFWLANVLFALATVSAIAGALRLLGVRDWRCYGAAFVSWPAVTAVGLGAVSPFLLLGVAALWRYRRTWYASGPLLAFLVVLKLFLWPVAAWLLATRRYRAAAAAAALALVSTLAAWWAIGFAGLAEYPDLLDRLTGLVGQNSFSSYALALALGAPAGSAELALKGLSAVVFCALVWACRRYLDERQGFLACLGAALLLTPILWPHYLVLLFVPVAFASRTFSALWLAPSVLWLGAEAWSNGLPVRIVPLLALTLFLFANALVRHRAVEGPAPVERGRP